MKFLIIGLGNIGKEYDNTRHNIGFQIVDRISDKISSNFKLDRYAFHTEGKYKGKNIHIIKPSDYVNNSGKAVHYWMEKLKINLKNILVISDDISLPYGKIRVKKKGSDGGHNGLKSINKYLKSSDYPRLRFGVDNNFRPGYQSEYVLGNFNKIELKDLDINIETSSDIALNFCHIGIERIMNKYN